MSYSASPPLFLAIIKIRINKPYVHWRRYFDEHAAARAEQGIQDVLCAPVIGEQAVVYAVRTPWPRRILDSMYEPDALAHIKASGHVVGEEHFILCESPDAG